MSDNAEEGIFKAQAKSGAGAGRHRRSIAYLDDRILVYLIALGVVGLFVVWLVVWALSGTRLRECLRWVERRFVQAAV